MMQMEYVLPAITSIIGAVAGLLVNVKKNKFDVTSMSLQKLGEITEKWQEAEKEILEMRIQITELHQAIIKLTAELGNYKERFGSIK